MPLNDESAYGNLQNYKLYLRPNAHNHYGFPNLQKSQLTKHQQNVRNLLYLMSKNKSMTTWDLAKISIPDDISKLREREKIYRRLLVGRKDKGKHSDGILDLGLVVKDGKSLKTGKADLVIGSRFLNDDGENVPSYRKTGIKILTKLANTSLEQKITDSQSGFRGYGKRVIEEVTPSESGMGVSNEILIKASKKGFQIIEVPIVILYEGDTSSQNPLSHGSSVFLSTLKFISMEHPLKFYGIPGGAFLTIGIIFLIYTIQLFSETRQIITNVSLIGIGSTLLGVVLCTTSIMLYSIVSVVRERR